MEAARCTCGPVTVLLQEDRGRGRGRGSQGKLSSGNDDYYTRSVIIGRYSKLPPISHTRP